MDLSGKEFGLVFAGGGTKGAFEAGASKALTELGIKITGVAGTSIGSVNGAMFVTGQVERMLDLYSGIRAEDILEVPEDSGLDTERDLFTFGNLLRLGSEFIEQRGISNAPFRKTLEEVIDVDALYGSEKAFGICTYDRDTNRGLEIFREEIPKEQIIDYLLASCCLPLFRPQVINRTSYADGAFHDNMPVNMLLRKGFRNVILVDVNGIGRTRKLEDPDAAVRVISPSADLGGIFDFNHGNIIRGMKMGYLDTMKAFRRLTGNRYYFDIGSFHKLLEDFTLEEIRGLEKAAELYGLDRYKVWEAGEFLDAAEAEFKKDEEELKKTAAEPSLEGLKQLADKRTGIAAATKLLQDFPTLNLSSVPFKAAEEYGMAARAMKTLKFIRSF